MRPALSIFALTAALAALSASLAGASERMEKKLKLAPGGHFRLETDLGAVTVTGSAEPDVALVVTSRHDLDDLLTFRFDESPSSVVVTARRKHHFGWFDSGHRVQYEIRVPAETAVDVDTSGGKIVVSGLRSRAKLDTSGGGIDVRDLVGDLEADTSGGGIHLADIKGRMRVETSGGGITGSRLDGPLAADTSGGSIDLDRVSGDIKASSSGGGITILEAGGRVEAETSGGGIEATFARGNARGGSLETSGGGIRVSVDPEAGLEIDAHGNSVKTELPLKVLGEISRSSLRGTLGSGGAKLHLRTSGGGVVIQGI
jgi:DUF4097 and DUF4098 domain-containing protein YvlB